MEENTKPYLLTTYKKVEVSESETILSDHEKIYSEWLTGNIKKAAEHFGMQKEADEFLTLHGHNMDMLRAYHSAITEANYKFLSYKIKEFSDSVQNIINKI